MSAFLGPIHYWLYNKIQQQQVIVKSLYLLGEKQGMTLEADCIDLYGAFPDRPLEEMIDHGNIHGWLQERVSQVEYSYAYCVTKLIEKNPKSIDEIIQLVQSKAKDLATSLKDYPLDAAGIYKVIADHLLDGMPCDHAYKVQKQDDKEVLWTRNVCVHFMYWTEVGGDIKVYYHLRDAWISALTKELGFVFEKPDTNSYCIKIA